VSCLLTFGSWNDECVVVVEYSVLELRDAGFNVVCNNCVVSWGLIEVLILRRGPINSNRRPIDIWPFGNVSLGFGIDATRDRFVKYFKCGGV